MLAHGLREAHVGKAWPAERWQSDPVGFCRTILGVQLWAKQEEILIAIRDHRRVAVAGGRKIGKDFVLACAALWWLCSFPDARVFMTATTAKQIDGILWRQVRQLYSAAGRCLDCKASDDAKRARGEQPDPPPCPHSAMIVGRMGELARTGLVCPDLREIKGYTADNPEGMAGLSGARILAIVDEASGYPDAIHVAIRGNLAASGCKEVLISNPTRAKGFFFEAFHREPSAYHTIQVSSLDTPNYVQGIEVFPGLASREWVEDQANDWGRESALFRIHVKGEFVLNEEGSIFPVHALAEAMARWSDTHADGPLQIGVDPAGEGTKGDEAGFACRKGKRALQIYTRRGLSPDGHVMECLGIIAVHGSDKQAVRIVVDREGETGARVWGAFVAYFQAHPDWPVELVGLRSSERAHRQPQYYDRVRDELCAVLADWLRDGGALPEHAKLSRELTAFRWVEGPGGRTKVVPKDQLREELGRSPDHADALTLAVWGPNWIGATAAEPAQASDEGREVRPDQVFDPYAGGEDDGGSIDPYAGA